MRRQYIPLSLLSLQRLIDLGRIDFSQPIDLTTVCNTKVLVVKPDANHYGINLIDEVRTSLCCCVSTVLHMACQTVDLSPASYRIVIKLQL